MSSCINIVVEALQLFLQSLPFGSKFNVISYGSNFTSLFKDTVSVEYNEHSLKQAQLECGTYTANMGGTEIYKPLQHIFDQI